MVVKKTSGGVGELHNALRDATKVLHHRLDHHPLLLPLMRPDLTIRQYGDALLAFYALLKPLEADIEGFLAAHPGLFDYDDRRKSPLLESDINAIGRLDPADIAYHPCWQGQPLHSIAELIGVLYCTEGSMLGTQVIVRQLRSSLPPAAASAICYFSGYGAATESRWLGFWEFANRHCTLVEEHQVAISRATVLFEEIKNLFDSYLS